MKNPIKTPIKNHLKTRFAAITTKALPVALLSATLSAQTALAAKPVDLFRRPLILGASVSAGQGTPSPGVRLSERYSSSSNVRVVARGGTPGREMIHRLTAESLRDRTVVVAVDFLFWDSTYPSPEPSFQALESLIQSTSRKGIPLIIGDIPEMIQGGQPQRDALNRYIHSKCLVEKDCFVLSLDQLRKTIAEKGSIAIKGRRQTWRALVPDGLHLSPIASDYLADRILDLTKS